MTEKVTATGSMVTEVKVYFTFVSRDETDLGTIEVNISGAEAFTVPRKKESVHLQFRGKRYSGKVDQVVNDINIEPSGMVSQQLFVSCKNSEAD